MSRQTQDKALRDLTTALLLAWAALPAADRDHVVGRLRKAARTSGRGRRWGLAAALLEAAGGDYDPSAVDVLREEE